ncbi:uncharacterized protein [Rutidosis leptorrhynchoides]|uniref:uncharacterized protein n=1 Tax=Rutidosis leptorrhynchoides TaxID=125765 RepID=UPI003A999277
MVQGVGQPILNEVWKHFAFDSVQVHASGRSGGKVSMWKTDFFIFDNELAKEVLDCYFIEPDACLQMGDSDRSDHKPIIWGKKLVCWGPKPFRFNNQWLSKKGFVKMCSDKWDSYLTEGWAAFILNKNLRLLKADLKLWNVSFSDQVDSDLKNVVFEIKQLKLCHRHHDLTDVELNTLVNLKKQKKILSIRVEAKYRLHSRFHWLKLGDKNTRFFHLVSRIKQQSSYIAGMQINNLWEDDPSAIKEYTVQFFENLFLLMVTRLLLL